MSAQGVSWAQRVAQRRNILALSLAWSYSLERKRGSNKKSSYLAYRIKRLFYRSRLHTMLEMYVWSSLSRARPWTNSYHGDWASLSFSRITPADFISFTILTEHALTSGFHHTLCPSLPFRFFFFFFFPLRGTDVPLISGVSLASNARGLN